MKIQLALVLFVALGCSSSKKEEKTGDMTPPKNNVASSAAPVAEAPASSAAPAAAADSSAAGDQVKLHVTNNGLFIGVDGKDACKSPCDVMVKKGSTVKLTGSQPGGQGELTVTADKDQDVTIPTHPAGLPPKK